jgi:hypothetical protein
MLSSVSEYMELGDFKSGAFPKILMSFLGDKPILWFIKFIITYIWFTRFNKHCNYENKLY